MKPSLNRDVSSMQLKPFTGSFYDIPHSYRFFTSQYFEYDHFLCSIIDNILISAKKSDFTLVFLKWLVKLILGLKKNLGESISYFLRYIFQKLLNTSPNNHVSL